MKTFGAFLKKEAVFCIASLCAVVTLCISPPQSGEQLIGYIDIRILGLLFALMTAVAGLRNLGVFNAAAHRAAAHIKSPAAAVFALWFLCFVSSVFITNDVALLTFVPLAAAVLSLLGASRWLLYTVVLQTAAANLGSLLTPMGNPQNLFLYSFYNMSATSFFRITVPLFLISFVLLVLLTLPVYIAERKTRDTIPSREPQSVEQNCQHAPVLITEYVILSLIAVLSVFRVVPWQVAAGCAILLLVFADHRTARSVDWFLLLTFCMFFIFSGTVSTIEPVRAWLSSAVAGREKLAAICVSQIISNVPAALLLSSFTSNGAALVAGTNIGGLGTVVASLASLISYKLYCACPEARPARYMAIFTIVNVILLAALLVFDALLSLY